MQIILHPAVLALLGIMLVALGLMPERRSHSVTTINTGKGPTTYEHYFRGRSLGTLGWIGAGLLVFAAFKALF